MFGRPVAAIVSQPQARYGSTRVVGETDNRVIERERLKRIQKNLWLPDFTSKNYNQH